MKTIILIFTLVIFRINGQTNGKCPSADKYCLTCETTNCTMCAYSYLSAGQCTAPTTKIDNCMSYSNATTCSGCKDGYYLSSSKCVAIPITNCILLVSSTDTTVCSVCANNKSWDTAGKKCSDTNCTMANCANCSVLVTGTTTTQSCIKCGAVYALLNSDSTCPAEKTANCFKQNATVCMQCDYGYYWKDGSCLTSDLQAFVPFMSAFVFSFIALLFQII